MEGDQPLLRRRRGAGQEVGQPARRFLCEKPSTISHGAGADRGGRDWGIAQQVGGSATGGNAAEAGTRRWQLAGSTTGSSLL